MSSHIREGQRDDLEKSDAITGSGVSTVPKSAEEKKLVRKIDLYLMPSVWFLYLLAVSAPLPWSKPHSNIQRIVHGPFKYR